MKCLTWDPNDGDRSSARTSYMPSAQAAAERFAAHNRAEFEVINLMACTRLLHRGEN